MGFRNFLESEEELFGLLFKVRETENIILNQRILFFGHLVFRDFFFKLCLFAYMLLCMSYCKIWRLYFHFVDSHYVSLILFKKKNNDVKEMQFSSRSSYLRRDFHQMLFADIKGEMSTSFVH